MIDPFRGERTAKYIQQENLAWAERERLIRGAKPPVERRRLHLPDAWWLHARGQLERLILLRRRLPTLQLHRLAH